MINSSHKRQLGISLIEALIAVVILSFGMLALASLQAQLFRAGAETKARATATAFAQGRIEAMRSFRTLSAPACPADNPFCDYESIDTGSFGGAEPGFEVAGVTYYGCTQVRRFRTDDTGSFVGPGVLPDFDVAAGGAITCDDAGDPAAGAVVSSVVPEFKEVTANIGWFDQNGELKRIQLTDTIAAISPDDALQLAKTPPEAAKRPIFEIDRAALNATPGIVPIATGDNRTAASTNPTPKQYVDQLSSLTSFDVMNFVGAETPDILKVTRNISMSAVSCVCSNSGATASDALPAFEPTVFNGKRMAYETPERKPNGLPVGSYVGSSSDSAIKSICTVCCRDHHDSNQKRNPDRDAKLRVDPYRTLDAVAGSHKHYGFQKQGQGYVIDGGLLLVGSVTDNEYVEACKVVEVDGRLRLSVDARQNNLTLAAMDASQSGFEQADFVPRYSNFVKDYVAFAVKGKPANYP
ncbi:MAG TPA: prepilin-type N-terminal cleavage/methylation domain-containing protein, partial [Lysobacter sp.]|nr:prepilin-type N-terminal cleavage/methylation domain-containing protein [Lysobacter sp.]